MTILPIHRLTLVCVSLVVAGCTALQPDRHLATFSTDLTGRNEMPRVATAGSARVAAVLDRNTLLLRWKLLSLGGLRGAVTGAHFHGPATANREAATELVVKGPIKSPMDGRATLTAGQAADLLAGQWYVDIHTTAHPGGEIRGQLVLRE